ncbi:MAG: DUF5011 domain-containing protein [Bacteroidota bacterium]
MKKFSLRSALLLLAVVTFVASGCKKEDTVAPVITLLGDNPMTVEIGGTFTDPGATATDDVDGDLTSEITSTGTVDPNTAGHYHITYSVTDAAGNNTTAEREVDVEIDRAAYLGGYTVSETCPSPYGLNSAPTISAGSTDDEVVISLFYFNGGSLSCTVDGATITVNANQTPQPWGDTVTGSGTFDGSVFTLNLTFSPQGGNPDVNCTATYTKQ